MKWKGGFLKLEILRQTAVQDAVVLGKPDWSGCCCTSVSFLWDPHQVAAELVLWEVRQLCQEEAAEHPPLSCEPFFFLCQLRNFLSKNSEKDQKKSTAGMLFIAKTMKNDFPGQTTCLV